MKYRTIALLGACIALNSGCMMAARAWLSSASQTRAGSSTRPIPTGTASSRARNSTLHGNACLCRLDRNGDGYFDKDDMSGRLAGRQKTQERLAELVTQLDRDGDGRVSKAEFVDGPTPLFDRADTDHNGELSKEEVAAIRARTGQRRRSSRPAQVRANASNTGVPSATAEPTDQPVMKPASKTTD